MLILREDYILDRVQGFSFEFGAQNWKPKTWMPVISEGLTNLLYNFQYKRSVVDWIYSGLLLYNFWLRHMKSLILKSFLMIFQILCETFLHHVVTLCASKKWLLILPITVGILFTDRLLCLWHTMMLLILIRLLDQDISYWHLALSSWLRKFVVGNLINVFKDSINNDRLLSVISNINALPYFLGRNLSFRIYITINIKQHDFKNL